MFTADVRFIDRDPVEVSTSHAFPSSPVTVAQDRGGRLSPAEEGLHRVVRPTATDLIELCEQRAVGWHEVGRLAAIDPARLSDQDKVGLLRVFERLRAQIEGLTQSALAAVAEATRSCGLDGEFARHEVAAALRLSSATAASRVEVAEVLIRLLPETLDSLCTGDITYLHARHLADTVAGLDPEVAAAVQARVLAGARNQSLGELRRSVEQAVLAADPEGAQQRHEAALAGRRIVRRSGRDAMEGWWMDLPATAAGPAWARLTDEAKATQRALRKSTGADPGLDALRVDALVDAILGPRHAASDEPSHDDPACEQREAGQADAGQADAGQADAGQADAGQADAGQPDPDRPDPDRPDPDRPEGDQPGFSTKMIGAEPMPEGVRLTGAGALRTGLDLLPRCRCGGAQTVAVVVDLPTLLGLVDNPAEIPGYGPVSALLARELAADRDWERWVTHPRTRQVLDRSPLTYRPGARLRGFVAAAHRDCGFPGCTKPAEACDLDHRVSFRVGGRTKVANLGPLCRDHHNAKTHGGWTISYDAPTETWHWTSPLGMTYPAGADPPARL